MIKKIAFFLIFLITISFYSQDINFDKYKYIIVANKFDFLKKSDQYQTSSLTKFLFEKKNFKVFLGDKNLPEDLINNRCLAVFVKVLDDSSMLTTSNKIEINDCFGKNIYTSPSGKSKLKDYKRAYQEAIRNAFKAMPNFKYNYTPTSKNLITETNVIVKPKVETPIPVVISKKEFPKKNTVKLKYKTLYAQPNSEGFQLVNTKPEVVFVILKTEVENVYIIKDKNGILYKNNDIWVAEYYKNNLVSKQSYQIKF